MIYNEVVYRACTFPRNSIGVPSSSLVSAGTDCTRMFFRIDEQHAKYNLSRFPVRGVFVVLFNVDAEAFRYADGPRKTPLT